jgi:hypothetical protein
LEDFDDMTLRTARLIPGRRGLWMTALAGTLTVCAVSVAGDAQALGPQVLAQNKIPAWRIKKDAKAAYVKGKALMKKGDYAAAAEQFEKADELVPGAAPKYQIAVCYDKLGDAQKAVDAYKNFISSNPGEKYADRVVAAGKRVAELQKQLIGKVVLKITPAALPGQAVTVDGEPVEGTELELEPGEHTIIVTADGHTPVTQTVNVQAGEPLDVPITLEPEKADVPPPPPPEEIEDDGGSTPGMGLRVAGYVTFGITVAGGVLTGVFGAMALSSASEFEESPSTELADDTESQALLSDVFLGVTGAAAIATGLLLYFGYTAEDDGSDTANVLVPEFQPYGGPQGGGANLTWKF